MAHRRNYILQGTRNVASPTQTWGTITATAAVRPCLYDIILGSSATPADNALLWQAQRFTAAGTSTATTPQPLDSGDPAATSIGGINHTIEPTYTANLFMLRVALNQRATHRWIADPDAHIICPATANNGVGLFPVHASFTGAVDASVYFYE